MEEKMKTRMEYIKELRKKFLIVLIPSVFIFVLLFLNSQTIITNLMNYYNISSVSLSPSESISVSMNLALAGSLLFFVPFIIIQLVNFSKDIIPKKAYRGIYMKGMFGFVLATTGFIFGITYLGGIVIDGLMLYNIGTPLWSISSVLKTTFLFGLGIATSLQMIWFIPVLNSTDIINKNSLKKARPFIIVGLIIASALITPPDVLSQMIMFVPLYGSFETGLLFSRNKSEQEVTK
jgi:sec-independent protein translocase protein TatC